MGLNSKAVEARERKATEKKEKNAKVAKAAEDALWADDDRNLAKKKSRKEEEDRKKAEALKKKAENKLLLEKEMDSIKTTAKPSIQKVTQAQIRLETDRRNKVIENINQPQAETKKLELVNDAPLVENLNRLDPDTIEASGIDQAIAALR